LVCGEKDITITPATVRAAFKKQQEALSLTEFKLFPGRSHFLFAEPGWEAVGDYALTWAAQAQTASTVRMAQRDAPASVMPLLKAREEN
jgi:hypothetical protein